MTYISKVIANNQTIDLSFNETHQWELCGGYTGPVQAWTVSTRNALLILAALGDLAGEAREITLIFGDPDKPVFVFRVILLAVSASNNPQRRELLMTDIRWYFTRSIMVVDANIRRRVGETRLVGDQLEPVVPNNAVLADTIKYAAWSTNSGVAYDWLALKRQVLDYLTVNRHGRPNIVYVTDTFSINVAAKVVQEMSTDGPGFQGLARAIESIPGASIYVDLFGTVHVYDAVPGAEKTVVEALPKSLMGFGDLSLMSMAAQRPQPGSQAPWRVYVDYEIELRLDYDPDGSRSTPNFLEPVIQVTDISLKIPQGYGPGPFDILGYKTVGQGSWITQNEAFGAWGGAKYGNMNLPQITDGIVARHWFGDSLQHYTVGELLVSFDAQWSARVAMIMQAYRTIFRVNPVFWDRIRHAWPVRAAVWDPSTGARAPAPVYQNYNITPTNRYVSRDVILYGINNTKSYPADGRLANGYPSGFLVEIVDEEAGIIQIVRDVSRFPGHSKIAPSPTEKAANLLDPEGLIEANIQQLITTGFKLATVISVAPGAPNDLRRLYEIPVSYAEALLAAGLPAETKIKGYAPDQELRSQLADARVAWRDDDSTGILTVLGALDAQDDIGQDDPVRTLVPVNLTLELQPLARAMAAVDLISKLDRYVGTKVVPMNQHLVPLGSIDRVIHKVSHNRAVSIVHCSMRPPSFSALDFLSGSARSYLLKQIAASR